MEENTTFNEFRNFLMELLRGYPDYAYFGKVEFYLRNPEAVKLLVRHEVIELATKKESKTLNKKLSKEQWTLLKAEGKKEPIWYRLKPRGVDLAISLISLERSEKMLQSSRIVESHSKTMKRLTWIIAILTLFLSLNIIFGLIKIFITQT